jgi:hypothetical protein
MAQKNGEFGSEENFQRLYFFSKKKAQSGRELRSRE